MHRPQSSSEYRAVDLRIVGTGIAYQRPGRWSFCSKHRHSDGRARGRSSADTNERHHPIDQRTRQNLANALEELQAGAPATGWRSYIAVVLLNPSEVGDEAPVERQLFPLLVGRMGCAPTSVYVSFATQVQVTAIERACVLLGTPTSADACLLASASVTGATAVWLARHPAAEKTYPRLTHITAASPGRFIDTTLVDVLGDVAAAHGDGPYALVHEGGLRPVHVQRLLHAAQQELPMMFAHGDDRSPREQLGDLGVATTVAQLAHAADIADREGHSVVGLACGQPGAFVVQPPEEPRSPIVQGEWPWGGEA